MRSNARFPVLVRESVSRARGPSGQRGVRGGIDRVGSVPGEHNLSACLVRRLDVPIRPAATHATGPENPYSPTMQGCCGPIVAAAS